MDEIPQIFKDELQEMLEGVSNEYRPRVAAALDRIAAITTSSLMSGERQNIQHLIRFDLSSLASLLSASVSDTEAAIKKAMQNAMTRALTIALDAIL